MKKNSFLFLLLIAAHSVAAQYTDTIVKYFDWNWKEVNADKAEFQYFRIAKKTEDGLWHAKDYFADTKTLQMECMFIDDSMTIQDGECFYYYKSGALEKECRYHRNNYVGLLKHYHENGQLCDSIRYKSTGIPYHKSYHWDDSGRLLTYGDYGMAGSGKGYQTEYYEDGTTSSYGKFAVGYVKDSTWTYYYDNGKISMTEAWDSGRLVHYDCYATHGTIQKECDTGFVDVNIPYSIEGYVNSFLKHKYNKTELTELKRQIDNKPVRATVKICCSRNGKIKVLNIETRHPEIEEMVRALFESMPDVEPARHKNRPIENIHSEMVSF